MNMKYYQRIANWFQANHLANDLIDFYRIESGIREWNLSVLDVVISLIHVKGYSFDALIDLIS